MKGEKVALGRKFRVFGTLIKWGPKKKREPSRRQSLHRDPGPKIGTHVARVLRRESGRGGWGGLGVLQQQQVALGAAGGWHLAGR